MTIDADVLPPRCNCDGIKTIDTPCPIHGFDEPDNFGKPLTGDTIRPSMPMVLDDLDTTLIKED